MLRLLRHGTGTPRDDGATAFGAGQGGGHALRDQRERHVPKSGDKPRRELQFG